MATYKFNAVMRYGKFHGNLYLATGEAGDPLTSPAQDNTNALSSFLQSQLEAKGLDEDSDTVIFRNNSYSDWSELEKAVRLATY
jgi:hypothetical protein